MIGYEKFVHLVKSGQALPDELLSCKDRISSLDFSYYIDGFFEGLSARDGNILYTFCYRFDYDELYVCLEHFEGSYPFPVFHDSFVFESFLEDLKDKTQKSISDNILIL